MGDLQEFFLWMVQNKFAILEFVRIQKRESVIYLPKPTTPTCPTLALAKADTP